MFAFRPLLIACLYCMAVVCLAWPGTTRADTAVVINVDAANPPFMHGTPTNAQGLYPDLLHAVFQRMNQPVTLAAKPWKRVLNELDLGVGGAGGIYKTEERSRKYEFSEPLFVERIVVYYRRGHPVDFRGLSDLEGLHVGVLLGWSYGDDFDRVRKSGKIIAEEVASDRQNFDKLVQGRLDAVLAIEQVGTYLMSLPAFAGIEKSPVCLTENPTYVAFGKGRRAEELLKEFNRVLQEMKRDGSYAQVVDKSLASYK